MMCGYRVCHDNDGVTRLRFASVHLRPPLPSMLFVLRPRDRGRLPRPRPPTRCGLRPVTSSASSAASRANTASLSDASVASAFFAAARAAARRWSTEAEAEAEASASAASQHSRHHCFPGPLLLSCAREKASAGLSALHAAHSCVATVRPSSATRSFAVSRRERALRLRRGRRALFTTYLSARILPRLVRHVLAELHRGEALATACRAVERAVPLCRIAPGSNAQVRHRFPRHARVRAGTPGVSLEFPCV